MKTSRLLILVGKSGCGKDYICKKLQETYGYTKSIACTTRPPRVGEENGKDYHFITTPEFEEGIDIGLFAEYRVYHTTFNDKVEDWYYGTYLEDLTTITKDTVLIKDLKGACNIKKLIPEAIIVYVETDDKIRTERAIQRGSFCETEWERRLRADNIEFAHWYIYADHIIMNDDDIDCLDMEIDRLIKDRL